MFEEGSVGREKSFTIPLAVVTAFCECPMPGSSRSPFRGKLGGRFVLRGSRESV